MDVHHSVFSLSVNEQLCLFWQKKFEPKMCRTSMSSIYACTQLKKQRRKHGITVTSARLPSGCPCCSIAATCGHHRWDWAFPHGSHKQRTHCLVSVFSHFLSVYIIFSVCKCSCVCFCRCNQVMCIWMFLFFVRRLGI